MCGERKFFVLIEREGGSADINNLMIPQSDTHPSYPIHMQIQNIYNLLIKNFGEETASQIAMTALNDLKTRSGGSTSYATLVKHLSINVGLDEKVKLMTKEELELELVAKESELSSIKRNFEEEINIRTKQISAERNKLTVMLSAISDSVIGLDLERNVVIANNAAEQLIGLTKTITQRIYHLIKGGVAPHKILAITFTNKAAAEMRERVLKLLQQDGYWDSLPLLSTFHALCVQILRENSQHLGLSKYFSIIDKDEGLAMMKTVL
jgi:PAS domain-containing protein